MKRNPFMSLEELIDAEATTQKLQKRNDTDGPTKKWPTGSRSTRLKLSYQIFFRWWKMDFTPTNKENFIEF